jgi:2''-5'' RNA ligase
MVIQHNTNELIRTFIAIKITESQALSTLQSKLKAQLNGMKVKWVPPSNYHITLRFIGHTEKLLINRITEELGNAAINYKPFDISLFGFGFFGQSDKPKVLWADVAQNSTLEQLAADTEELVRKLGFSSNFNPYKPHLTLARPRGNGFSDIINELKNKFGMIPLGNYLINSIYLYQSIVGFGDPIYQPIKEIKLLNG